MRGRFPGLTNQIMMQRPFLSALAIAALMGVLAPADAQAQALFGAGTGRCGDTRHWGELHDVDDAWDSDADGWDGFHGAGLMWWGELHAFDVDAYFDCWTPGTAPSPDHTGYSGITGQVVPLGWGPLTAQSMRGPMQLASLTVGTGWTGAALTFRGYQFGRPEVWTQTTTVYAGAPAVWSLATPVIDYFTLGVEFETAADPFNSAAYQYRANQLRQPYQTYFVSEVAYGVVPEPSSYAMLGAGLLALWGAVRRRSATRP